MERDELIQRLVLNEICDDYENVDQRIFPNVSRCGATTGLKIERNEVVEALTALVRDGRASAFLLDSFKSSAVKLDGMPSLDVPEQNYRTYFLISEKGMELHLSRDP